MTRNVTHLNLAIIGSLKNHFPKELTRKEAATTYTLPVSYERQMNTPNSITFKKV